MNEMIGLVAAFFAGVLAVLVFIGTRVKAWEAEQEAEQLALAKKPRPDFVVRMRISREVLLNEESDRLIFALGLICKEVVHGGAAYGKPLMEKGEYTMEVELRGKMWRRASQ